MRAMSKVNPLVSIVTASYQCADYIEETYRSLVRQTISDWEWVVVDDASFDGTFELLQSFSRSDPRVKVYQNAENSGAAISRNLAIDIARGDYLAFIDSDDLWVRDKLEKQLAFFTADMEFTFTGYSIVDEAGVRLGKDVDTRQKGVFGYDDMLAKRATLGCSTVMLRSASIGDARMPKLRTAQDYAYWLKLLRSGMNAHLLPLPLTLYRVRKDSLSSNKVRKAIQQWKIYRDVEELSLLDASRCFMLYAARAVLR